MNALRRAIAEEFAFSSPSSRKCLLFLQSISTLQQSSLYSTTSTSRLKDQQQPRYRKPKPQLEQSSPSLSSASFSEVVQKKAIVSQRESEKEMEASNNWPRPSEIPWQTQVANSVNLIGRVQIPVQFQASPDGKYWAGTIISQQDEEGTIFSSDSPPFWIPIIFEGDLAHIAACHLKEKDCVYIAGQLSADPPPFTISQGQANVQVMVRSINFVQGSSQLKKSFAPCKQEKLVKNHPASVTKEGGYWMDLLKNPKQWWDHRENKLNRLVNPKHPDFKHKDSGDALWLDRAPKWVLSELEGLEFDVQLRKTKQVMDKKEDDSWKNLVENPKDDSWKNLVENPSKWWDNRLGKVNVKSPDFKHKDTGEALWLNDSPAWVLTRLPPLKTKENLAPGKWKLRS